MTYAGESKVIFSFEGDENIVVYDYGDRKIVHEFPLPIKGEKAFSLISVADVIRLDIIDETGKRTGLLPNSFPSRLVFLQSDKSLSVINLETFESREVLAVKFGYSGIHVEYSQKQNRIQIYTNRRQGQARNIWAIEIPLD
jgi:hypothetical protein